MHNCPWKIAFLLLLAVNLLLLIGLYVLSRPEDLPQEEETAVIEKSNYEITMTKEALESAIRRGLKESASDARFSIADGFYFRIPVEAYPTPFRSLKSSAKPATKAAAFASTPATSPI